MDKTTLGLIAAIGALAAAPALANTGGKGVDQVMNPRSVAELLEPIANPVDTLAQLEANRQLEDVEVADADIQIGPLGIGVGHHHHHRHYIYHHHHHHQFRRHHHHHHHYNNY